MLNALNPQQQEAVDLPGNLLVTACPGSGKTRVLVSRVIRGLEELTSRQVRVVALTYTNRAADEMQTRLDRLGVERDRLWVGTIHSFALDWILRPYAPYADCLRRGFSVADEFHSDRILDELKTAHGAKTYYDVSIARNRRGAMVNCDRTAAAIAEEYKNHLASSKLVDYDDVLYTAYKILIDVPEAARTLASIIRLICVDEIQDVQDLQYAILSAICRSTTDPPTLFFVGDPDQCIYESLGAVTKSPEELAEEFGLGSMPERGLTGNYRSTQRIIDFYQQFRPGSARIESLAKYAGERGLITFQEQSVPKDGIPTVIADLIGDSLRSGVAASGICVLAPQWWHVRALGRALYQLLPDVDFDAPGLSPLHSQRDNHWFKVARLFLSTPRPGLYGTRLRWAGEVLRELRELYGLSVVDAYDNARALLRLVNSIPCCCTDGLAYLDEVTATLAGHLGIDVSACDPLQQSRDMFFKKATKCIRDFDGEVPTDVQGFRRLFRHPNGVVVSTCHGTKGEEYSTVIAFGLLKGYVPNWKVIMSGAPGTAEDQASKLLYVVCSRARKRLHLIAESGRKTQSGAPYRTTALLHSIRFDYDPAPRYGGQSGGSLAPIKRG